MWEHTSCVHVNVTIWCLASMTCADSSLLAPTFVTIWSRKLQCPATSICCFHHTPAVSKHVRAVFASHSFLCRHYRKSARIHLYIHLTCGVMRACMEQLACPSQQYMARQECLPAFAALKLSRASPLWAALRQQLHLSPPPFCKVSTMRRAWGPARALNTVCLLQLQPPGTAMHPKPCMCL